MTKHSPWRDGRLMLIALVALMGLAALIVGRRARHAGGPDRRQAGADAPVDLDGDGQPDPVELLRLASSPAAAPIVEAIRAAGGFAAWRSHREVRFTVRGVLFDERGFVAEERTERCRLDLAGPPRTLIESRDGKTRMGHDAAGPWGAEFGSNGLWSTAAGPGALPPELLQNLVLEPWWLFGLPFRWGDVDARVEPAPPWTGEAPDTLTRVVIVYPPAPGDTAARSFTAAFDRETGYLRELQFRVPRYGREAPAGAPATGEEAAPPADPGETFVMTFSDYLPTGGLTIAHRRQLSVMTAGGSRYPVYELDFEEFEWDPPADPTIFDRPAE